MECRNLNINATGLPFVPFQGICQEGCPKDFTIREAIHGNKMSASCVPCVGKECWKTCEGRIVDSVASAQKLKGCQMIEGAIKIQISKQLSKTEMTEFENGFSDIVEIEDYLKVVRSPSITSLSFLKSLKVIRGNHLDGNSSVVIWDNQNLKKLFKEKHDVEVKNGKLFFHLNPKLCFKNVEDLAGETIKIESFATASKFNGYQTSCNASTWVTKVEEIQSNEVSISWKTLKTESTIKPKFVVFYTKAVNGSIGSDDSGDEE